MLEVPKNITARTDVRAAAGIFTPSNQEFGPLQPEAEGTRPSIKTPEII